MAETQEFGGGFHIGEEDKVSAIDGVGIEGEMGFHFKCFLFLPESLYRGELTIVLPGFGHRASSLGESFRRTAKFIAETVASPTIIPLEDWDPNHLDVNRRYTYWTLGGLGRSIAVSKSLDLLDAAVPNERKRKLKRSMGVQGNTPDLNIKVINFIGYSYHGPTAVELGAEYLPRTGSVVCVAPVDNRLEMPQIAQESGLQLVSGEPEYKLLFGSRGLPLINPLAVSDEGEKQREEKQLERSAQLLKTAGVPIKVLYGRGDPIMPMTRSQSFAQLTATEMKIVESGRAVGSAIHDFDDPAMMQTIADALL